MSKHVDVSCSKIACSVLDRVREEMAAKKCRETKELLRNLGYSTHDIRQLINNALREIN